MNTLAKNYLKEAQKPSAKSRMLEASLRSPEMLGTIKKLGAALYGATKTERSKALKPRGLCRGETQVSEALENLFETAADFVTPDCLFKCEDLFTVGGIALK